MAKKLLGGDSLFRNTSPYPKCKIFDCTQSHSGTIKRNCCHFCNMKMICEDPCLNHPDRCGQCVYPEKKEDDKQKCGG